MSAEDDIGELRREFGRSKVVKTLSFRGEQTIEVTLESLREILKYCLRKQGYAFLLDISSVDNLGEAPRFEIVYELAAVDDSKHLRVKAPVEEGGGIPTVSDLWATANWHEREVFDMMGLTFKGHPDLRRILMWEGYPYFPLRKDFPLAGKPSEMPDVAFSWVAPLEGGPFVTRPGTDRVSGEPRGKGES